MLCTQLEVLFALVDELHFYGCDRSLLEKGSAPIRDMYSHI